jgi:hypothetical protein
VGMDYSFGWACRALVGTLQAGQWRLGRERRATELMQMSGGAWHGGECVYLRIVGRGEAVGDRNDLPLRLYSRGTGGAY